MDQFMLKKYQKKRLKWKYVINQDFMKLIAKYIERRDK